MSRGLVTRLGVIAVAAGIVIVLGFRLSDYHLGSARGSRSTSSPSSG